MKKFLRRTIPLLIPILLLALFSRVPLAQPEQTVPEEACLVGYLLPDELVPQLGICRKRLGGIQFLHSLYQWLRTHPSALDCSGKPRKTRMGNTSFPARKAAVSSWSRNSHGGRHSTAVGVHLPPLPSLGFLFHDPVCLTPVPFTFSPLSFKTTPLLSSYNYKVFIPFVFIIPPEGRRASPSAGGGGRTLNTKYSETLDDQVTSGKNILISPSTSPTSHT